MPQNTAIINAQAGINLTLRPEGMKAGISVRFPAVNFEAHTALVGDAFVQLIDDGRYHVVLGLHIAGRGDDDF